MREELTRCGYHRVDYTECFGILYELYGKESNKNILLADGVIVLVANLNIEDAIFYHVSHVICTDILRVIKK